MNNRKAFTIVELITTVSIIALLLGLLLPSIAMVRAKAKETAQKAQFNTIAMALEAFNQDYGDYPPSNVNTGMPPYIYMGAQKLAEALLGWDLMGFHPKTGWRADGYADAFGSTASYDPGYTRRVPPITGQPETLFERKDHYIELATANTFRISALYPAIPNDPYVLCDVYRVRKLTDPNTGKTVFAGSPILYYKANTANKTIDPTYAPKTLNRIYDYNDNMFITSTRKLTANGPAGLWHPFNYLAGSGYPVFYSYKYTGPPPIPNTYGGSGTGYGIRDPKISSPARPYNPDTYILISAGPDGYYGTADDIHNF